MRLVLTIAACAVLHRSPPPPRRRPSLRASPTRRQTPTRSPPPGRGPARGWRRRRRRARATERGTWRARSGAPGGPPPPPPPGRPDFGCLRSGPPWPSSPKPASIDRYAGCASCEVVAPVDVVVHTVVVVVVVVCLSGPPGGCPGSCPGVRFPRFPLCFFFFSSAVVFPSSSFPYLSGEGESRPGASLSVSVVSVAKSRTLLLYLLASGLCTGTGNATPLLAAALLRHTKTFSIWSLELRQHGGNARREGYLAQTCRTYTSALGAE